LIDCVVTGRQWWQARYRLSGSRRRSVSQTVTGRCRDGKRALHGFV